MDPTPSALEPFAAAFGELLRRLRKKRGWRQIELAVEIPVDHSLVSRWETGAVLPAARDLNALRRVLGLDIEEQDQLEFAWRRQRQALTDEVESAPLGTVDQWIESIRVSVECVRSLRKAGQPRLALTLGRRDAQAAFDQLRSTSWSPGHFRALAELSELLLEECKAGLDYLPSELVRQGELRRTLRMQDLAASGSGEPSAKLLHVIAKEGVAYVSGNFGDAHLLGVSLLDSSDHLSPEWIPEVVRACGINAGRLRSAEALEATETAVGHLLSEQESLARGTRAFVLEGLARGWGGIEPERAVTIIERAWSLRDMSDDSEGISALRYVQLVRSQAEVELALRCQGNRNDTLDKIQKALAISAREAYDKYVIELTALANRLT